MPAQRQKFIKLFIAYHQQCKNVQTSAEMLHVVHFPGQLFLFPVHDLANLHTVVVESTELVLSVVCCVFLQSARHQLQQLLPAVDIVESEET